MDTVMGDSSTDSFRVDEVGSVPTERLEAELVGWSARLAAATGRWLVLLGEYDRRGAYEAWGCWSCAQWVVWQCGLDPRSAREHLRVARALQELPLVRDAMLAGELSYSRVRALTRLATPASEAELVGLARHCTAAQLERLGRTWTRLGQAGDPARAHAGRSLTWDHAPDGSLVVTVRLPADAGDALLAAVDACLPDPRPETREPMAARRADALMALVERAVTGGDGEPLPVELVVDTDPERLAADPVVQRLACDPRHHRTSRGGRRVRLVRGRLRRRLWDRDQGCRFPGCGSRTFLHAHHLHHWAHGGPTRLDNLLVVCGHHHRLVHDAGWQLHLHPDGTVTATHPHGWQLRPDRLPAPAPPPEPLPAAAQRPANQWDGSPLHLNDTITALRCLDPHPTGGSAGPPG